MVKGLIVSPQAKAAWRLLRDEGGFWTASEVGEKLADHLPPSDRPRVAGRWLSALHARCCVSTKGTSFGERSYGVTAKCFAPEGESMECTS